MPSLRMSPSRSPPADSTEKVGFLLLPEFPIYALIPAIESLRIANQNAAAGCSARICSRSTGGP